MLTETKVRRIDPDITVVEIGGRLTLGNTLVSIENSTKRLIDEGTRRMIIDVAAVNAIDSSGIGFLVSCFAHMEQKGGNLRVSGAQASVAKVLRTAHIERIVPMDPDLETARQSLPDWGINGRA